ncbi:MAG TPA: hypothetical protein VGE52_14635, partial [Pirellulales bacterium]
MTRRLISLAAFALLAGGSASSAADPALPGKSVQENSPREISSPGKPPASKNSFGIKPEGITSPAMQAALERLHRAGVVPARRGTLTFFRWTESEPPRLAHLGLWGEAIDNELFALAADLPDLEHVSLYETNVNDDGLAVLSRFTKLRTFSVLPIARYEKAGFGPPQWSYPFMAVRGDRPRVTGRVLEALRPSSAALQRLDLLDAAVSHSDLAGLAEFPRLSSLSLPGPIDDETVRRLQACPRLNSLTLGERAVTAAELRALSAWKSLRTLTLVHATLSDDALTALAELQTLQELTL